MIDLAVFHGFGGCADKYEEILTISFPFSRPKSSIVKRLMKAPISLDLRQFLSFHQLISTQPLSRRFSHERTPQTVYAQLLIGYSLPCWELWIDEFVKSQRALVIVAPAKVGISGKSIS